jgi:sulfatase modifying factor 1
MSSSQDDTILPPPRKPSQSNGLDGETVLPSNNPTGIHSPGDLIDNRYTVIREIGRGGMGVVYEVLDAITGDHYAIKRLLPEYVSRPDVVEMFRTEGAASMRFTNKSQRFVTTQMVDLDGGIPYIVLQLIRLPTLRVVMQQAGGHLSVDVALPILTEVATALKELHGFGYVHRDLKPENIFVDTTVTPPAVLLVDFGLSKDAGDATRTVMRGAGTERYASPEQVKGEATTPATDIYAFGVIAYESLTGELPRFGETVTDYVPAASPELVNLITACLAGKAEKRPQNGNQLLSQFATLLTKRDQIEKPVPKVAVPEPKQPESQPARPTVVRTTLSFEGVQDGAIVEVDRTTLVKPFVHVVEIETNARKAVSVLIRWQDQVVFEKQITLVAGANQLIKVPQAYRVECAVPAWCSVKDTKRSEIRFPVRGLLSDSEREAKYILVYDGADFDTLTSTLKVGVNTLAFKYGLASLRIVDVPSGCHIFVNGTETKSDFSVPLIQGRPATLSVRVKDQNRVEIYRETVTLEAGESKTIRVPTPAVQPAPVSGSTEQTAITRPSPVSAAPSATETSLLSRRLLIGGGIAGAVGGGWFVMSKLSSTNTPYKAAARKIRDKYPRLADYVESLRSIPAGRFQMGGNKHEDEAPIHKVSLSSFVIGATPVTVALWKEYATAKIGGQMPPEPSWGMLDDHPIVNVSWNDIMGIGGTGGFCAWASDIARFRLTLPTEAQWEYAARGGVDGQEYPWGDTYDDSKLWCSKEFSRTQTASVKRTSNIYQNEFLLTDMSGNVWQWCSDFYGGYGSSSETNPTGPTSTSDNRRCVRGGSWISNNPVYFRCADRDWYGPDSWYNFIGFRLSAGPS